MEHVQDTLDRVCTTLVWEDLRAGGRMVGPPRMRADGTQTSSNKDVGRSGHGGERMTSEDGAQVTV